MPHYLRIFFGALLAVVALVVTCNMLVDPYQMTGSTLLQRWAGLKTRFGNNHVLGKPFVLRRRQPQALIFGTSRENHGIDPNHPAWPVAAQRTYNLAMDAANMANIERLFDHARQVTALQEVVIALDFLNMFDSSAPGAANFDGSLLADEQHSSLAASLNAARYFVSWPMLHDSLRTLLQQDPDLVEFEHGGRRNARVFERAARRFGQHHMFEYSEANYLRARLPLPPDRRYLPQDAHGPTLRHLARTLDMAAAANINVRLYITPVHARQLEVYRTLGLWQALEDWKQDVLAIASGSAASGGGLRQTRRSFQVWDFADYSTLTSETVPAAGDTKARMQWYWESSHYRKQLGDKVLERIFAVPAAGVPEDFGVLLNALPAGGLHAYLENIRSRGAAYRTAHPDDLADLERLAAKAR